MATVLHSSYLGLFYVQHSVNDARRSRLSCAHNKNDLRTCQKMLLPEHGDGRTGEGGGRMCTYCSISRLGVTEIGCDIQRSHRERGKKRRASTQLAPEPAVYVCMCCCSGRTVSIYYAARYVPPVPRAGFSSWRFRRY